MINLVSESVTHNYYAHAACKEELFIKVNTRDSFSFLVDKIKKGRRKKRKNPKHTTSRLFNSLEASLTDALFLFPQVSRRAEKKECSIRMINSKMWIANIQSAKETGGRLCQPNSSSNLELAAVSENALFFLPVGCQWFCHRREETMLSKEGHMWLCGEGRGRLVCVKSLTEFLSRLSRQVLTVNTPLISLCIFMTLPPF